MINFKEYIKVSSLEEAWLLNQKRRNRIIGGMLWLRLTNLNLDAAIDLSGLGLDRIEENNDALRIGAMATLSDLEGNKTLQALCGNALAEALGHIVGVQFRNMATIGGTVYGRYGFSDVLTLLLTLDTTVVLYKGGEVPLETYISQKRDRDIVTHILISKKNIGALSYLSVRAQKTDFPTFTCCVRVFDGKVKCVYGARPGFAKVLKAADGSDWNELSSFSEEDIGSLVERASQSISTGSNIKGSAGYRTRLIKGLTKRALQEIGGNSK